MPQQARPAVGGELGHLLDQHLAQRLMAVVGLGQVVEGGDPVEPAGGVAGPRVEDGITAGGQRRHLREWDRRRAPPRSPHAKPSLSTVRSVACFLPTRTR